jgi:EAL domain-containing protein (putative c-di-GMP-specific phosphodiesterase class I)
LFYQPQISTNTNTLYGAEALSRWNHATLGPISPSCFIPIAENTGQIEAIGLWSLEEACRQIGRWDIQALHVPVVSVNLSALQLKNRHLPEQIAELLARYDFIQSSDSRDYRKYCDAGDRG